jgi:hypothetical protein
MNKREADTILLGCKKYGIFLTMRKEGDIYLVTFIKKLEIASFEAAKHITNGLAVERKFKNEIKERVDEKQVYEKISVSNYPKRRTRDDVVSFAERTRNVKE